MAKAPVPGEVKTRLSTRVGDQLAADLAAAALLDTLDACEAAFPTDRLTLALAGDLAQGERSVELAQRLATWQVFRQRGQEFGSRLVNAHLDASVLLQSGVVQIGMDTPQVCPEALTQVSDLLDRHDAVIGPAVDGGWWALGLSHPRLGAGLVDVPMSTSHTAAATRTMLIEARATVATAQWLNDVDTWQDAELVAAEAPHTRFGVAWQALLASQPTPVDLFDAALAGASCRLHGLPQGSVDLPISRWRADFDPGDDALLSPCFGPTLDIGCGPGRLTYALASRGVAALGIDIAPGAVRQTQQRGAQALQRDVFGPLPAEGRWSSVLLADGNIGIGGDPARLLRRVFELLAPGGQAVVELAEPGVGMSVHEVQLEVAGRWSTPFGWAIVGAESLAALAEVAALRMLDVSCSDGRWFATLVRDGAA